MRFLVILARLAPLTLSFVRDYRRWVVAGAGVDRTAEFHRRRAERMVATIAALGPTFVKLAQLFAGRADLIPEPYVSALSHLVDQVPAVEFARIRRVIEESYGASLEDVFTDFDPEPLAAASLGQVYRARVRQGGEDVAVKVLRPGVELLIRKDVRAAARILAMVERRWPNPHVRGLRSIVNEFARRVPDEMDFRLEAANAREIRSNFAGVPGVLVPRVHEDLVTQRVLVLELMEGERIDRWMESARLQEVAGGRRSHGAAGSSGRPAERVLSHVIELYMRMMLVDGLFHADPHPGNLFVAPDGSLVVLDFGMVVRVPHEQRWHLVQTVFAAIRSDADGVVQGFQSLGMIEPSAAPGVIRELVETLLALAEQHTTVPERVELLANEVMSTMYDWPVVLPPDLVYFARTAGLIEGLGVRYDRYFNPISFSAPIALRMRAEILRSLRADAKAVGARELFAPGTGGLLGSLLGADGSGVLGEVAGRVLALPGVAEGVASFVDVWRGSGVRGAPPNSNITPNRRSAATTSAREHPDSRSPLPTQAMNSARDPETDRYDDPIVAVAAFAGTVLGTALRSAAEISSRAIRAFNEGRTGIAAPPEHSPRVREVRARLLSGPTDGEPYPEPVQEGVEE